MYVDARASRLCACVCAVYNSQFVTTLSECHGLYFICLSLCKRTSGLNGLRLSLQWWVVKVTHLCSLCIFSSFELLQEAFFSAEVLGSVFDARHANIACGATCISSTAWDAQCLTFCVLFLLGIHVGFFKVRTSSLNKTREFSWSKCDFCEVELQPARSLFEMTWPFGGQGGYLGWKG